MPSGDFCRMSIVLGLCAVVDALLIFLMGLLKTLVIRDLDVYCWYHAYECMLSDRVRGKLTQPDHH